MTGEDPSPRPDGGRATTVERSSADESETEAETESTGSPGDVADWRFEAGDAAEFEGEDLVIRYASGEDPVVDGESIRVPPGRVTALVGPNGSGKSTLLKGLADQLTPEDGVVRVDGRAVPQMDSKELARRLGLLSQENVAPDTISVEELVGHGRYPYRGFFETTDERDREAIDRAIDLAGVDHLRDREVGSLSGGQKQLAWIAMALAQDTDVLLLDEPTTFLDLHHQLEVMEIVETLRDESEVTVVVVLHDVDQAARYADHVVALRDGSIYDHGPPAEVVTEELLAEVFEVEASVTSTEDGPQVVPKRPLHEDEDG